MTIEFADIDCGEMQGFLFARPMSADAVSAHLRLAAAPTSAHRVVAETA